jgi:hypothetical protein
MKPDLAEFSGQWIGNSQPDGAPMLFSIVNIEKRSPGKAQVIGTIFNNDQCIRQCADGQFELKGDLISGMTGNFRVFDPNTDRLIPLAEYLKQQNITETPSTKSSFSAKFEGSKISGEFTDDFGKKGRFEYWRTFVEAILKRPAPKPEPVELLDWNEFKQRIATFCRHGRVYFRGQHSNSYPLRTAFHRTGRTDLIRYVEEDIPRLRHRINTVSAHVYQNSKEDYLGLLGVAQHHGFPTPLLDWTLSPYVAAFFAFDCLNEKSEWLSVKSRQPVRIFIFDLDEWLKSRRNQAVSVKDPWPDVQFVHPPAHNNPRYYPQQSIAAFSNVDDIEGFVAGVETQNKIKCLTRIDIRADQRQAVEDELRFMGITAAALFPGLEGICKCLRSELF